MCQWRADTNVQKQVNNNQRIHFAQRLNRTSRIIWKPTNLAKRSYAVKMKHKTVKRLFIQNLTFYFELLTNNKIQNIMHPYKSKS